MKANCAELTTLSGQTKHFGRSERSQLIRAHALPKFLIRLSLTLTLIACGWTAANGAIAAQDLVNEAQSSGPFAGCTITFSPTERSKQSITGKCLGHSFANPRPDLPEQVLNFCQLDTRRGSIYSCLVDRVNQNIWSINAATGDPASTGPYPAATVSIGPVSARQEAARQERERQQQEQERQQQAKLAALCPAHAPAHATTADTRATVYGLVLGEPLPCINNCSDEPAGSKTPMCRDSGSNLTPWGTQQLSVRLNVDVLDFVTTFRTGNPILELLDGKLVGVRFPGINQDFEDAMVDQLSLKYGEYQYDGRAYLWRTPGVSVRYAADDHLSSGAIINGLLTGEAGSGSGTITIYTPSVRALVDRYETQQTKVNKKPGL